MSERLNGTQPEASSVVFCEAWNSAEPLLYLKGELAGSIILGPLEIPRRSNAAGIPRTSALAPAPHCCGEFQSEQWDHATLPRRGALGTCMLHSVVLSLHDNRNHTMQDELL